MFTANPVCCYLVIQGRWGAVHCFGDGAVIGTIIYESGAVFSNSATFCCRFVINRAILNRLLIDLSWASSNLEGNTYFVMVHIPYLQPFADINKRTSRIAANLPLIRANLCPLTFLDVPEQAYSRAILGVYELGRFELLRDLFVWAYERSTQEYLAIKQDLSEPDPLRLSYRKLIKEVINRVVTHPEQEPLTIIQNAVRESVDETDGGNVEALIIEELRRLHEGVLARYGLRPSELERWKQMQ